MNYPNFDFWQVLLFVSLRYFMFAGAAFFIFYVWKNHSWISHKIQQKWPTAKAINTELVYSIITILIFAGVLYGFLYTPLIEYTQVYLDFSEHSIGYFFFSVVAIILMHDTYFYWTHRLMHWNKIFPYVHQIHHKSHNPTPLAAFSFHPIEAFVEIGIIPLIIFTFPVHRGAIAIFSIYMISMNVIGHLGFEMFPKWFLKNKISKWFNTSTHHNMHHHYGRGNYGLYFNLWDRLLGTNHPNYEKEFNTVIERREKPEKLQIKPVPVGKNI